MRLASFRDIMNIENDWLSSFSAHKWRQFAKGLPEDHENAKAAIKRMATKLDKLLRDPIKFMEDNLPRERIKKVAIEYGYFTDCRAAYPLRYTQQLQAKKLWKNMEGIEAVKIFDVFNPKAHISAKVVDLGVSAPDSICAKIETADGKHCEWVPTEYIIAMSAAVPFGKWGLAAKKGLPVALWLNDEIVAVAMPVSDNIKFQSILSKPTIQQVS